MTLDNNTLSTFFWMIIAIVAINAFGSYAICRLFVTGKAMFERRQNDDHERSRIHQVGR